MGHLAIDIGASNGKVLYGDIIGKKFYVEEINRFENNIVEKNGTKCWDIRKLEKNIINSIEVSMREHEIESIGIDTWGVDFVLIDKNNNILGDVVSYRDNRTMDIIDDIDSVISNWDLYTKTGIHKQSFNSIYQILYLMNKNIEIVKKAKSLLLMPDYFNFVLTGNKKSEYTNSTTTQLINNLDRSWDYSLMKKLDIPERLFSSIVFPPYKVGNLKEELCKKDKGRPAVISVASHDTASAVVSIPATEENPLFLISGTWSLIGTETNKSIINNDSFKYNYTNEGGFLNKNRFIKNIMGLWILQSVKKELENDISYEELDVLASKNNIQTIIDCNDKRFLSPKSMTDEILAYICETNQQKPSNLGELIYIIYNSLSIAYNDAIKEIEHILNMKFNEIYLLGGGTRAKFLNQLIENKIGKNVIIGPSEASGIGNIMVQMYYFNKVNSLKEIREIIKNSELNL